MKSEKTARRKATAQNAPAKRQEICRILKEKGFKRIPALPDLFLNDSGQIYSLKAGKELKPTAKNQIVVGNQRLSLPKLVLLTFRKQPVRDKQQIRYIDGNRNNLSPQNLEYVRQFTSSTKNSINYENLKTAIRCYFEVHKRYNTKDYFLTRTYIAEIIRIRNFYDYYSDRAGIDIFENYIENPLKKRAQIAKETGINMRDCNYILNEYTNLLISDILADLQTGNLTIKGYLRNKTKTQRIKETNEVLKEIGIKPVPLRKKSIKEKVRDFKKYLAEIKND